MNLEKLNNAILFIEENILKHKLLMSVILAIIGFIYKFIESLIYEGYSAYFNVAETVVIRNRNIVFDIVAIILVFILVRVVSILWMHSLNAVENKLSFIVNTTSTYIVLTVIGFCGLCVFSAGISVEPSFYILSFIAIMGCVVNFAFYRFKNQKIAIAINFILFVVFLYGFFFFIFLRDWEVFITLLNLCFLVLIIFIIASLDHISSCIVNHINIVDKKEKYIKKKKLLNKNYMVIKSFYVKMAFVVLVGLFFVYLFALPESIRSVGEMYAKNQKSWLIAKKGKNEYLVMKTKDSFIGIPILKITDKEINIGTSEYIFIGKDEYVFRENKNIEVKIS